MTREWERLYQAAIVETDWYKIDECIQQAEAAMKERLHDFSLDHGGTPEENRAIQKAFEGLAALREDVSAWRSRQYRDEA
jgi:hypothetical protein